MTLSRTLWWQFVCFDSTLKPHSTLARPRIPLLMMLRTLSPVRAMVSDSHCALQAPYCILLLVNGPRNGLSGLPKPQMAIMSFTSSPRYYPDTTNEWRGPAAPRRYKATWAVCTGALSCTYRADAGRCWGPVARVWDPIQAFRAHWSLDGTCRDFNTI